MKTLTLSLKNLALIVALLIICGQSNAQTGSIPELVFTKATLVSGKSNQDGAVYRFKNVATGVDATMTIVGRSASNVVLDTIDLPPAGGNGFDKSLQPQLGIHGNVPANSSWWMKFKLDFYKAGTSTEQVIDKFTLTALDIDGDGSTIAENVQMFKATAVTLAPISVLTKPAAISLTCSKCHKLSLPIPCLDCLGLGYTINGGKQKTCGRCEGTGLVYLLCNHAWEGSDLYVPGTTANAGGIDTLASQNMATFTYNNTSSLTFSYGAKTGNKSTTAGQRLNSMWFKSFAFKSTLLPVTVTSFTAAFQKQQVDLAWSASAATNFSHYVIQRSTDGINFTDHAMVFGAENGAGNANYTYTDKAVAANSVLYYRLKMVDNDGSFTYSATRTVRTSSTNTALVSINAYPNPATNYLLVTMPASWIGKNAVTTIYNASGVPVQNISFSNIAATERINTSALPKGFYIIHITDGATTVQTKMVKN